MKIEKEGHAAVDFEPKFQTVTLKAGQLESMHHIPNRQVGMTMMPC